MFNALQNVPSLLKARNNNVLQRSTSILLKSNFNVRSVNKVNSNFKLNNLNLLNNNYVFQRNLSSISSFQKNGGIYNIDKINEKKNKDFEDFEELLRETLKEENDKYYKDNSPNKNTFDKNEFENEYEDNYDNKRNDGKII